MAKKTVVEPIGEVEPMILDEDDLELDIVADFDDLGVEELTEEEMTPSLAPVKDVTDLSSIEAMITDVDDRVEHLTWVVYGKNGTGKTTLLSTAEGVLILAAEDGTLSIRSKADKAKKIRIDTWEKLEAVYWLLKDGVDGSDARGNGADSGRDGTGGSAGTRQPEVLHRILERSSCGSGFFTMGESSCCNDGHHVDRAVRGE